MHLKKGQIHTLFVPILVLISFLPSSNSLAQNTPTFRVGVFCCYSVIYSKTRSSHVCTCFHSD